ncbi:GM13444 [Drosophila sechellia]|uniref:GM13444 n=1 Tax=Drosophila sechellia TaxID=7238 RepID=B4IF90_DROSE|nr:GM13444 [Drosophila sechellia]
MVTNTVTWFLGPRLLDAGQAPESSVSRPESHMALQFALPESTKIVGFRVFGTPNAGHSEDMGGCVRHEDPAGLAAVPRDPGSIIRFHISTNTEAK